MTMAQTTNGDDDAVQRTAVHADAGREGHGYVVRALALTFALPTLTLAVALGTAWLSWGLSYWSGLLAVALTLLAVGLFRCSSRRPDARRWLLLGSLLLVCPLLVRTQLATGSDRLRMVLLPALGGVRLVNTLYPESDGARIAAGVLDNMMGGLDDEESTRFGEVLGESYARIGPDADLLPTPAIATYLGMQSPRAFDSIVIPPASQPGEPTGALIFLHGYAGNFLVYCWEAAQAASAAGLLTVCPSETSDAGWWTKTGEQTFVRTVQQLRAMGIKRIYLAGLSNGAAGASVIAMRHQRELAGLILISGVRAAQPPSLPTLVIQGSRDRMMVASRARAYAARGANARYEEVAGGHLIFLSRHERVRSLIAGFLSQTLRSFSERNR